MVEWVERLTPISGDQRNQNLAGPNPGRVKPMTLTWYLSLHLHVLLGQGKEQWNEEDQLSITEISPAESNNLQQQKEIRQVAGNRPCQIS